MKKKILSLILALCCLGPVVAQTKQSPPPAGPAPVIQLGKYEEFQLKNGLKVYVVENHKLPVVTMSLLLDVNPVLEGNKKGYVDMAGQLMRTGTKTRSKDQLDEEIDFIGASLSTSATSVSASSLKKHLPKLMELTADVLLNPQFKQEELDKLKKQAISGLASSKDSPGEIEKNLRKVLLYGKNHPYGELMTEETVENITLQDVENYYNTTFKPNVGYLAIVGDITPKEAKKLVNKYFGKWKKGDVKQAPVPAAPAVPATAVAIADKPGAVQTVISVANPIELKPGHPDVIAARIMNNMLGGSFKRLTQNLREKHGFSYGSNSALQSDRFVGYFNSFAEVRTPVTDSAIHEMLYELNRIRTEKAEAKEVEAVKNAITGDFARSLENPNTVALFAINTARYNLPKDYYANYLKNVAAVTADDVMRVAQKYIQPDKAYIIAVGNANEIGTKLNRFSKAGQVAYYNNLGEKVERKVMAALPAGLTAETVLANYIKAIGGKANLEKVKDMTMKSKMSMQGMELSLVQLKKSTDKYAMEMKMGEMPLQKKVINGKKGKVTAQGQSQALEGASLEDEIIMSMMNPELRYDKMGVKPKLTGIEDVNGREAFVMEFTLPSGAVAKHYFDKENGLRVREMITMETPQGAFSQTMTYSDYKEVSGVKYPYVTEMSVGPQTIKATVESIEVNKGLKDDQFKVD